MKPKFTLRDLYWLMLVVVILAAFWQVNLVLKRRSMLQALTANGCYWDVAEVKDIADRPNTVVPMLRSMLGDTPVACIFVDRTPMASRYHEVRALFPEAMMPVE